ncbi:MAG: fumarate reductase flavoprotein subunit, partial [Wenzhouxiangella sp.]
DSASDINVSTGLVREFVEREQAALDTLTAGPGSESATAIRKRMEEIMIDQVGIFRTGKELDRAVGELEDLLCRSRQVGVRCAAPGANPELVAAYRLPKMLKLALCAALGARQRSESRGAHFREDFPQRNDRDWLNRSITTWPAPGASLPRLDYEAIDVADMELPPGFRGYGTRDHIDHPDSAPRQAEVEKILKQIDPDDHYARQAALMPFDHLLPEKYRPRNQRLETKP